jgi:hypothetical protein
MPWFAAAVPAATAASATAAAVPVATTAATAATTLGTLNTLATIGTVAGAGVSAYSSIQQGKEAEANAKYNSGLLKQQATQTEAATEYGAIQNQKKTDAYKNSMFNQFGSAGLDITGTPLSLMADTAAELAKDQAMFTRAGMNKASYLRNQAQGELAMGADRRRAGLWQAGTSLLAGGTNMAILNMDYNSKLNQIKRMYG